MIKKWLIVPVIFYIWILSLTYISGIGRALDIYNRTKLVVVGLSVYHVFITQKFRMIRIEILFLFLYLVTTSCFTYFSYGKNMTDYLWLYLLIPLIAMLPIHDMQMRIISIICGVLGMIVLFIYNYGSAFDGWNTNNLAMIALISFCIMIISFNDIKDKRIMFMLVVYTFLYFIWSEALNCRSGTIFAIVMILGVTNIIPIKKMFQSKFGIYLLLLLPLIIAILVVLLQNMSFIQELNEWSELTFKKSLFNGRNTIWQLGFETWAEKPFFGNGNLSTLRWHNSAVTALVGGGAVGYIIWIVGVGSIFTVGSKYCDDKIVFGLMLGFIVFWLQQTVDLGLIAAEANALPYAMLGMILGRVWTIKNTQSIE